MGNKRAFTGYIRKDSAQFKGMGFLLINRYKLN